MRYILPQRSHPANEMGCATYFLREVIPIRHFIVGLLPHPIEIFVQRIQDVSLGRPDSNMCENGNRPRMLLA